MAILLPQAMGLRRLGGIFRDNLIICIFLSKNSTSIEKRIKKVWIEEQGLRIKASLAERLSCPRSPFILWPKEEASLACWAITVPLLTLRICILSLEDGGGEFDAAQAHIFNKGGDEACGLKCAQDLAVLIGSGLLKDEDVFHFNFH